MEEGNAATEFRGPHRQVPPFPVYPDHVAASQCVPPNVVLCVVAASTTAGIIYLHVLRNLRIKDENFVLEMARRAVVGTSSSSRKDIDDAEFGDMISEQSAGDKLPCSAGVTPADAVVVTTLRQFQPRRGDFARILVGCGIGAALFGLFLDLNVPFGHVTLCVVSAGAGIFAYLKRVPVGATARSAPMDLV